MKQSNAAIAHSFKEDLRSRISITDLAERYTNVKKVGKTSKALCCFHDEKTPSLTFNETDNTFHCFGCGAKGDIFDFVMEAEGIAKAELPKAMKLLAGFYSIPVPQYSKSKEKSEYVSLDEYDAYFRQMVDSAKKSGAQTHLKSTLQKFDISESAGDTFGVVLMQGEHILSAKAEEDVKRFTMSDSEVQREKWYLAIPSFSPSGQIEALTLLNGDDKIILPDTPVWNKKRQYMGKHLNIHDKRVHLFDNPIAALQYKSAYPGESVISTLLPYESMDKHVFKKQFGLSLDPDFKDMVCHFIYSQSTDIALKLDRLCRIAGWAPAFHLMHLVEKEQFKRILKHEAEPELVGFSSVFDVSVSYSIERFRLQGKPGAIVKQVEDILGGEEPGKNKVVDYLRDMIMKSVNIPKAHYFQFMDALTSRKSYGEKDHDISIDTQPISYDRQKALGDINILCRASMHNDWDSISKLQASLQSKEKAITEGTMKRFLRVKSTTERVLKQKDPIFLDEALDRVQPLK